MALGSPDFRGTMMGLKIKTARRAVYSTVQNFMPVVIARKNSMDSARGFEHCRLIAGENVRVV